VSAAEPLMTLRGLTVTFPSRRGPVAAVRGVDLDLMPGRVLSLIGESGSGKSTVLLALAGLLPRTARLGGTLALEGRPGNLLAGGAARHGIAGRVTGMIFQNPSASLNPVLTVGAQIEEVLRAHRDMDARAAREEALALLARVGIGDARRRAEAYPHQLSGGLKQRVAIAAALAGGPRLILADEPTTALDATVQAQILDLLLDLVDREGVGLLMVTHDMGVAGAISDTVAVMYAGRIVEEGPARGVTRAPAHPYSAALVAAALPLRAEAGAGRDDTPFPALPPAEGPMPAGGCAFAPRCARALARCRTEDPALEPMPGGARAACFNTVPA
jgi:oligopeptide/dipeptide ABC transporter ATP-binding protein